ncbi:MAG: methyltransferase domain-containing protein [Proteobacteria bacterium]|nr:MAG: methyltransferase domain-containing protein [Pseudomonadota bacterium]
MHPTETHQLTIAFKDPTLPHIVQFKDDFKNWLIGIGEETFVEGALDNLFEDPSYEVTADEQYSDLGGGLQPLFVYKYDLQHLEKLKQQIDAQFSDSIDTDITSLTTESWMEGWKESFKPIRSARFYLYPPWIQDEIPAGLIPIVIEPGMAFGTGQHATTVLCMEAIETYFDKATSLDRFLDVGTGTGILAIAAKKLGFKYAMGTDIDSDAIIASRDNIRENDCEMELIQGSIPEGQAPFDMVVANIIFFVLKQIIGDLAAQVQPGGLLILSGLLDEEAREMEEYSRRAGLSLESEATRDDWAAQVYRKPV